MAADTDRPLFSLPAIAPRIHPNQDVLIVPFLSRLPKKYPLKQIGHFTNDFPASGGKEMARQDTESAEPKARKPRGRRATG